MQRSKKENYIRDLTIRFVKTPMEGNFAFDVEAGFGQKIVHRMRVELSRLRDKARRMNAKVKPFKMIVISNEERDGRDHIVLKKTQTDVQIVTEQLPKELLSDV